MAYLDHMGKLILVFGGVSMLTCVEAGRVSNPTGSVSKASLLPPPSPPFVASFVTAILTGGGCTLNADSGEAEYL